MRKKNFSRLGHFPRVAISALHVDTSQKQNKTSKKSLAWLNQHPTSALSPPERAKPWLVEEDCYDQS